MRNTGSDLWSPVPGHEFPLGVSLPRPFQFKPAVVMFRAVNRDKVRWCGAPLVVVNATEFAQIRFAIKFPANGVGLHLKVRCITVVQPAKVRGPKSRLVE